MTIATEITRIKDNISNTYKKAKAMGASVPKEQNSNNLAKCIGTIPQGGGGGTPLPKGSHRIKFYDYDGTLLSDRIQKEGEEIIFPEVPVHEHLTFARWGIDFTTVSKTDVLSSPWYNVAENTMYVGLNIDDTVEKEFCFSVGIPTKPFGSGDERYVRNSDSSVKFTVDFGDGSVPQEHSFSGSINIKDYDTIIYTTYPTEYKQVRHTYSANGKYEVKINIVQYIGNGIDKTYEVSDYSIPVEYFFGDHSGTINESYLDMGESEGYTSSDYKPALKTVDDFVPIGSCLQIESLIIDTSMYYDTARTLHGSAPNLKTVVFAGSVERNKIRCTFPSATNNPSEYTTLYVGNTKIKHLDVISAETISRGHTLPFVERIVGPRLNRVNAYCPYLKEFISCSSSHQIEISNLPSVQTLDFSGIVEDTQYSNITVEHCKKAQWRSYFGNSKDIYIHNSFLENQDILISDGSKQVRIIGIKGMQEAPDGFISHIKFSPTCQMTTVPEIRGIGVLEPLVLPSSVTQCDSHSCLAYTYYTKYDLSNTSITELRGTYSNNDYLKEIIFPKTLTTLKDLEFKYNKSLEEINFGDVKIGTTSLYYAFQGCHLLKKISFGPSTDFSGVTDTSQMFSDCHNLRDFPKLPGLTSIGYSFASGTAIRSEKDLHLDVMNLSNMSGSCFTKCFLLEEFALPVSVAKSSSSMYSLFTDCCSLRKIWIPKEIEKFNCSSAYYSLVSGCDPNLQIYTDAPEKPAGWGDYFNVLNKSQPYVYAPVHYGSTYEQYLQA